MRKLTEFQHFSPDSRNNGITQNLKEKSCRNTTGIQANHLELKNRMLEDGCCIIQSNADFPNPKQTRNQFKKKLRTKPEEGKDGDSYKSMKRHRSQRKHSVPELTDPSRHSEPFKNMPQSAVPTSRTSPPNLCEHSSRTFRSNSPTHSSSQKTGVPISSSSPGHFKPLPRNGNIDDLIFRPKVKTTQQLIDELRERHSRLPNGQCSKMEFLSSRDSSSHFKPQNNDRGHSKRKASNDSGHSKLQQKASNHSGRSKRGRKTSPPVNSPSPSTSVSHSPQSQFVDDYPKDTLEDDINITYNHTGPIASVIFDKDSGISSDPIYIEDCQSVESQPIESLPVNPHDIDSGEDPRSIKDNSQETYTDHVLVSSEERDQMCSPHKEFIDGTYDTRGVWHPWQDCYRVETYPGRELTILPYVVID